MKWTVLYQTEGPFEEIIEQLKTHDCSPQVFCDPYCHEPYIPGLQKGGIKCPQRFYIAVPQERRPDGERIIQSYVNDLEQKHTDIKNDSFKKILKALLVTLIILLVNHIVNPEFLNAQNAEKISQVIIVVAIIWTGTFIFLISKKPPSD